MGDHPQTPAVERVDPPWPTSELVASEGPEAPNCSASLAAPSCPLTSRGVACAGGAFGWGGGSVPRRRRAPCRRRAERRAIQPVVRSREVRHTHRRSTMRAPVHLLTVRGAATAAIAERTSDAAMHVGAGRKAALHFAEDKLLGPESNPVAVDKVDGTFHVDTVDAATIAAAEILEDHMARFNANSRVTP
jgi:hypothetical protein